MAHSLPVRVVQHSPCTRVSERPSLDETWMQVARVVSARATCSRLAVGSVLTRDGRIVSTGWNGAPAGQPHCTHDGTEQSCKRSIHSEANAIGFAARHGVRTDGTTLYVTHAPCSICAPVVVAAGVVRVVYGQEYRSDAGVNYLQDCGIQCTSLRA